MSLRYPLVLLIVALLSAQLPAVADEGWDVYLLIGQSNMAGRGPMEPGDTTDVLPGVWLLDAAGRPEPAVAPLNRYSTIRKALPLQEVGPGVSFGAEMHRRTGRRILIVQNARGGSSIRSWQPGAAAGYIDSAIVRTRQALRYGPLRGICWHQGETDTPQYGLSGEALDRRWEPENSHADGVVPSGASSPTVSSAPSSPTPAVSPAASPVAARVVTPGRYVAMFDTLAAALRAALGDVPIVVGEVGRWEWAEASDIALFNDSTLPAVCRTVPRVVSVSSLGLGRRWEEKPKDPHFSRAAALELGRRYAEAMLSLQSEGAAP